MGAAFASQLPGLEAIVTDSNGTESTIVSNCGQI